VVDDNTGCAGVRVEYPAGTGTGVCMISPGSNQMQENVNMQDWPDRRVPDLLKIEIPIIEAPMAGSDSVDLARSVSSTGALGSPGCALLIPDDIGASMRARRNGMARPAQPELFPGCRSMKKSALLWRR
jgi:hypothetical protein